MQDVQTVLAVNDKDAHVQVIHRLRENICALSSRWIQRVSSAALQRLIAIMRKAGLPSTLCYSQMEHPISPSSAQNHLHGSLRGIHEDRPFWELFLNTIYRIIETTR